MTCRFAIEMVFTVGQELSNDRNSQLKIQSLDMNKEIKAVIFDWAGTMIDFGSFAPMGAFVRAFKTFDIDISIDEARRPMGLPKRAHIAALLGEPKISLQWETRYGHKPTDSDIDKMYDVFVPINEEVAADYAALVPGVKETIDFLKARNIKIGSTTGYTRSIMKPILPVAAAQGYEPQCVVCSDDVIEGRPSPLGMYKCFVELGVYPPSTVIKVDDTEPGIAEGKAAGCITVGVTLSGNYVGKTADELSQMSEDKISECRAQASKKLLAAGADHVIDTVADLPSLIDGLR